jgi:hypothetical protein
MMGAINETRAIFMAAKRASGQMIWFPGRQASAGPLFIRSHQKARRLLRSVPGARNACGACREIEPEALTRLVG